MLIPIGHEQGTVHRQPWATYGLMIACVAMFLLTHFTGQARTAEGFNLLRQAVQYYLEHPYLELDPRLESALGGDPVERLGIARSGGDPDFQTLEQTELDGLTEAGFLALDDTPQKRWGLVPGDFSVPTLLTYMFLHAGWLHLLGNLLFLYLSGPFLEDVWGRPFFTGFYLVAGVFSGGVFALRYPDLTVPLIGASGAIAGVLGAFLVRHWNRRIRFFYWFFLVVRGTFSCPAWVILPLWFLRELAAAYAADALAPGTGGAGVAYWAHVSGFAFGAVVAAGLKFTGWEDAFLAPGLESRLTLLDNRTLDRALENRGQGRTDEAWTLLVKGARQDPGNPDTVRALWDVAVETGRAGQAAGAMARLVTEQLRSGDPADAFQTWQELLAEVPDARVPVAVEARLAEALGREGLGQEAAETAASAARRATPGTAAGLLVRIARLAPDPDGVRVARLALGCPELPPEVRAELEPRVRRAQPPPRPRSGAPAEDRAAAPAVRVSRAVPLALDGGRLSLEIDGAGRRVLPLGRIRAVAAAAIDEGGVEPNLVMDLVLVPNGRSGGDRVIRLETRAFDPRRLVPAEEQLEDAFLSLYGAVVAGSGAVQVLDAAGRPGELPVFSSLAAYTRQLVASAGLGRA